MENNELLSRVKTEATATGKLIIVWGPTGIGKTTLFCKFPKSVLVECGDNSAGALKETGGLPVNYPVITATGFYDTIDILKALLSAEYKFIVVDGGSGLKAWTDDLIIANECEGERGRFASYGYGEKLGAFYWQELKASIDDLRSAGITVAFICHDSVSNKKNPQGADYPKNCPALGKDRLELMSKNADAVLYMDFIVEAIEKKGQLAAKGVGGTVRVMYCQPGAAFEAKGGRLGLPPIIELGDSVDEAYKALRAALAAGKVSKKKEE